jgi:hypothetical protein
MVLMLSAIRSITFGQFLRTAETVVVAGGVASVAIGTIRDTYGKLLRTN